MKAVFNEHIWHRRLDHLNKSSLELMQRHYVNCTNLEGSIVDCDVRTVGKKDQLVHPKNAQHADNIRTFPALLR